MNTPIRYAGGKSKAYNIITELIPKMPLPERIISPFMGGGSLESRWSSDIGIEVISYDIFDALTNFHQQKISIRKLKKYSYNGIIRKRCYLNGKQTTTREMAYHLII